MRSCSPAGSPARWTAWACAAGLRSRSATVGHAADAGSARRPPAPFVLIPIGALHGLAGAALIAISTTAAGPAWMMGLGRLLVEQGVFLCWTLGVGGLVLPLIGGAPPPPDLGSSPGEG